MTLNQPGHQITFTFGKAMFPAERNRIFCTQFTMVTATAFGNVMEQGRQINNVATAKTLEH